MMMDISSLLLRDFSDLTRPELIARLRDVDILRAKVVHTHESLSPRKIQSFAIAIVVLIAGYALTDYLLLASVVALGAQIIVLRYSTQPLNWSMQLKIEITKLEPLLHSPLRQWGISSDTSWEFALFSLEKEIDLIHSSLSQPVSPFRA
ncbi:hypothetical protein AV551_19555 [Salmonella enterica]|nr:hypothetical protein [Salmonella enterica]